MEHSFTVTPDTFATAVTVKPAAGVAKDGLSVEQQAALAAVWAATNTSIPTEYEVSIASSDEGGWTVIRVAAVARKAE